MDRSSGPDWVRVSGLRRVGLTLQRVAIDAFWNRPTTLLAKTHEPFLASAHFLRMPNPA
jgi:hypothetical protein